MHLLVLWGVQVQDHASYSLMLEGSVLQGALGIFVVRSISPAQSVWGMSAQPVQESYNRRHLR